MSFWTIRKLISIAHGTYHACKSWTHRTSGLVCSRTVAWKYAYKNLTLHSRNPTHSVVMRVRSSTCDRSSRSDYWTFNSHNVNSMFAASGRFFHYRSHISNARSPPFSEVWSHLCNAFNLKSLNVVSLHLGVWGISVWL